MGQVFRAKSTRLNRIAVIKVLSADWTGNPVGTLESDSSFRVKAGEREALDFPKSKGFALVYPSLTWPPYTNQATPDAGLETRTSPPHESGADP
jgi:hypothetical protein